MKISLNVTRVYALLVIQIAINISRELSSALIEGLMKTIVFE